MAAFEDKFGRGSNEAGMMYRMVASNYPTLPTSVWDRERAKFKAEGKAEGKAAAEAREIGRGITLIRKILDVRGIAATPEELQRIESCADVGELSRWEDSALTASAMAEIFDPPAPPTRSHRRWRRR
jgi:hypothetical protein